MIFVNMNGETDGSLAIWRISNLKDVCLEIRTVLQIKTADTKNVKKKPELISNKESRNDHIFDLVCHLKGKFKPNFNVVNSNTYFRHRHSIRWFYFTFKYQS